jgi:hypothetical protein
LTRSNEAWRGIAAEQWEGLETALRKRESKAQKGEREEITVSRRILESALNSRSALNPCLHSERRLQQEVK